MVDTTSLKKLKFAHLAPEVWKKLDEIPRTGWVKRGVQNPETVQGHIVSLRNLAFDICDEIAEFSDQDKQDLVDMLEVHDWPEAIVGDLVILNTDNEELRKLKENKFKLEHEALINITKDLGESGEEILKLWLRFEQSDDPVAAFARQLDKYQALEKAVEIERIQKIPLFKEFRDSGMKYITHPVLFKKLSMISF